MSKKSSTTSQDGSRAKPQELMNEYLSGNGNGSTYSGDEEQQDKNFSNLDDDVYSSDPQEFVPNHRIAATSSYVPQYTDSPSSFPVQEVVPNTQMAMPSNGSSGGQGTGYRSRAATAVSSNILNLHSLRSNSGSSSHHGERSSNGNDEEDDDDRNMQSVPMMVKPKTLYQNPQTPTVLPSTYHPINKWSTVKHYYLKELLAEFVGTMVMMFFGCAVVCQVKLGQQQQKKTFLDNLEAANITGSDQLSLLQYLVVPDSTGTFDDIAFGWAGAVVMGYFTSGGSAISGAHLNPSITISNCIFRGFPWRKAPFYIFGQLVGSYVGSLIMFIYYKRVIEYVYPDWHLSETVIGMFCVVPQAYLSTSRQFISEYVIGAALQCGIFSLTDPYTCLSSDIFPLMLFVLIYCLNASVSFQTGAALNMARDLGPRLALYTVGFDRHLLWGAHDHFFWVPLVAPFAGAFTGAVIYDICIYQGHESPMNWPISMYKEKLLRAWIRRPRFYKSRKRSSSDLSDWGYDDTSSHATTSHSQNSGTHSQHAMDPEPPIQKTVQFKSVSRNPNARRNPSYGIPTIFEEDDHDDDDDDNYDDDDQNTGDGIETSMTPKGIKQNQRRSGFFKKI